MGYDPEAREQKLDNKNNRKERASPMLAKRLTLAALAAIVLLSLPQAFNQKSDLLIDSPPALTATLG